MNNGYTVKSGASVDEWVILKRDDGKSSLKNISSHIGTVECDSDVELCNCELVEIIECDCCDEIEASLVLSGSLRDDNIGTVFITTSIENIDAFEDCKTLKECEKIHKAKKRKGCN